MRSFKNKFFILVIVMFLTTSAHAQTYYGNNRHLTASEIERVKALKELLEGVDTQPLWKTIHELEKTRHPEINLEMKEAMAHAYVDIAKEFGIEEQKKKEWLYSMVCLNMAYLQFGGVKGAPGSTTELNRLIRQKLIKYLPSNAFNQAGFIYSLD